MIGFGGNLKIRLHRGLHVNVTDPLTRKTGRADIQTVERNTANRNYARRNIVTKGAIVQTTLGKARVTNRPGQDGSINAVLMSEA